MTRIVLIVTVAVLALGVLTSGCGSRAVETAPEAEKTQAEPGQKEAEPLPQGGSLSLYGIDPLTLDPAVSAEMTSHEYVMQIFGGLVRLGNDLEPVPDIARSWSVSEDGRIYTFHLREDVKFQNGRKVMAEDIAYSWERACWPETGSQTAGTYLGDISGVSEVLAGKSRRISGIRVLDDYTLEVTIDAPRPYFLYKLAYPTAFVVDRENVEAGGEWWRRPNGTGPFKLGSWQERQELVLERNPLYHGDVAALDSVVFHLWAGVPMNLYETDEIDVADVSLSFVHRATDPAGPFLSQLSVFPMLNLGYIGMNCARPPFDDVNVRRAFSQATDRERLAKLVYRDMVEPAYGILPPGIPGYNEELTGIPYSIEGARESIRASRYGDVSALPPITINVSGWGGLIPNDLEAIIHEWRENLGVNVKVRQLEPERLLYHLKQEKDEMYYIGWVADYPHPQDFLEVLFRTGAEYNWGDYSNAQVDALLDQAGTEPDNDKSLDMYRRVEQMLVDDAACLPLWFAQSYVLVKPHVRGYSLNPLGFASLNRVWMEDG